ncbi:CBM96 family carbohydrate-binding protein [Mucilaginibacter phyllosphaerae]|nr:DNRLRE domain-containing protein [Mucilaginibacter phyllosphaerae]MBB3968403.1 N-acetylneuraminic acid mutarotase [Mucilaginibacter phyllosphaerae]
MIALQNCKKTEAPPATVNAASSNKEDKDVAINANDDFAAITWGTVKGQPLGTHEIHGEAVNGKLYIFGGYDINKRPQWTPTKRAYVFDPVTNMWAAIKSLPHEPYGSNFGGVTHVGVTTDGTDIYFAGGYVSNAAGTGQVFGTKQVWKYSTATNTYTRLPDLPQALAAGQLKYLNGKIHYMGGANMARADINIHLALDLNNQAAGWQSLAPLNNAVNHPGSAVLNGKIYFIGGAHHQDDNTVTQRTLEVYDEQNNVWTNLANMPVGVDHISSSVITYGNRLIVLGGETSHNVLSNQVAAYNPVTNTWAQLTPLPAARSAGVAAVLNGTIYYTGGNFSNVNRKGTPVINTASVDLLPAADAFVRNGSFASTNYGNDTVLTIKGAAVNYFRSAYLKFLLNDITSISSATLRVYGKNIDNSSPVSLSCYGIDDDAWSETGLVFNNAPQSGSIALSSAVVNNQLSYVDFDVANYVRAQFNADKTVSLLIKDAANKNAAIQLSSKESNAGKPLLIIK